jgi:hypothetical protein
LGDELLARAAVDPPAAITAAMIVARRASECTFMSASVDVDGAARRRDARGVNDRDELVGVYQVCPTPL